MSEKKHCSCSSQQEVEKKMNSHGDAKQKKKVKHK